MKKVLKALTSRIFIFAVAILSEIFWLYMSVTFLMSISPWINFAFRILAIILTLWTLNRRINPSYQIAWVVLMLAVPVFGIVLYFMYGNSRLKTTLRRRMKAGELYSYRFVKSNEKDRALLKEEKPEALRQSDYIRNSSGFALSRNTGTKYYPFGDDVLPDMLEDLRSAKNFIFMEYFIIGEGVFWDEIRRILVQKAAEGVEVRVIYDDFGSASAIPYHYYKKLQAQGIKCVCFNKVRLIVSLIVNNRDHRKILNIDGRVAYTGGFNVADEYINRKMRFGVWKDAGVRITGPSVLNMTSMFLQIWYAVTGDGSDFRSFIRENEELPAKEGFVQAFSDMPLDDEAVGENVYADLISHAQKYIYIYTPYLVLDSYLTQALCQAGRSGIDVRIVTPGIPDKKIVYLLTRSNYGELLEAGARIFEYTPGFIHSKCMLSDDTTAVIGSINLDFRSLYLNFEDAVWLYRTEAVRELKEDMEKTFGECRESTLQDYYKRNVIIRFLESIFKIFAPLF